MNNKPYKTTLCWDCAKAVGKCNWSSTLKPVEGWKIKPTQVKTHRNEYGSCIVLECPEFERDAYDNGLKRYKENKDGTEIGN
ncbi:MAG: hypothetical protein J6Y78_15970 [Paludibacteraceae bacterium]|nr:hypothetical protein [Paludibacteraceae bacterium]